MQNAGRVSALVVVQTTVAKLDVTSNQPPWRLELLQPTDSCRMRVKHTRLQKTGGCLSLRRFVLEEVRKPWVFAGRLLSSAGGVNFYR